MFDLDKIEKLRKRAIDDKWPYPYLFNSLKSVGVERYEVNVLTHEIKYVGEGKTIAVPPPDGFTPLNVGPRYDLDGLKAALARSQAGEITYEQFLSQIAAAGIAFYRVDMRPRTVTYHGRPPYKYAEKVPET